MELKELEGTEPTLIEWKERMWGRSANLHFSQARVGSWMGITEGDRILFAIGYTAYKDESFFVQHMFCEPSKTGWAALCVALPTLRLLSEGRPVRFSVELSNHKMRRICKILNAKPMAVIFQLETPHV